MSNFQAQNNQSMKQPQQSSMQSHAPNQRQHQQPLSFSSMKPPFLPPGDYHRFGDDQRRAVSDHEVEGIVVKPPVSIYSFFWVWFFSFVVICFVFKFDCFSRVLWFWDIFLILILVEIWFFWLILCSWSGFWRWVWLNCCVSGFSRAELVYFTCFLG